MILKEMKLWNYAVPSRVCVNNQASKQNTKMPQVKQFHAYDSTCAHLNWLTEKVGGVDFND